MLYIHRKTQRECSKPKSENSFDLFDVRLVKNISILDLILMYWSSSSGQSHQCCVLPTPPGRSDAHSSWNSSYPNGKSSHTKCSVNATSAATSLAKSLFNSYWLLSPAIYFYTYILNWFLNKGANAIQQRKRILTNDAIKFDSHELNKSNTVSPHTGTIY